MPAIGQGSGKSAAAERKVRVRRPKPKPPTPVQIRSARAQRAAYVSQGKAVEKVANQQRKVRVARQKATAKTVTRAGDNKAQSEFTKGQEFVHRQYIAKYGAERAKKFYVPGTTVDPVTAAKARLVKLQGGTTPKLRLSSASAPVLTVLAQTTRPLHAIAGAERQVIKDKGRISLKTGAAFLRGLENKDKYTASDVIDAAGVHNKTIKAVGGTIGDIIGDPLTYVTAGAGSVAEKAALKAAKDAEKAALKKGLTEAQARQFGERAAAHAHRTASQDKGLTVRYAGHEVPGVRKATAKAAAPARKVARKVAQSKAGQTSRAVAADVNPNVAPAGVAKETSRKAVQATRTARGKINQGNTQAVALAHGIHKQIGPENFNRVVDAIEQGKKGIAQLPPELRQHAVMLRGQFKHIRKVQRTAGVKVPDVVKGGQVKGYVPRQVKEEPPADTMRTVAGVGRKKIVASSSKARKEKRPMAVVRAEKPGAYREDLHALAAERMAQGHTSAARADLNRSLADLGRPVKRGEAPALGKNEAVYHVKGSDIREVTDQKEIARASAPLRVSKDGTKLKGANKKGGRYVVLNKDVVQRAHEGSTPTMQGPGIVHSLDKVTSGFKRVAIGTPGFHLRNLTGDLQNAYLGQPAHHLPGNMRRAARVLQAHGAGEEALRHLKPEEVGRATLKTKQYGNVTYDQVAKELARRGAFRSGYTAGELRELSASGGKSAGRTATWIRKGREQVGQTRGAMTLKRAALNREDLPRLTTAIEALRHGATWEEAAQKVANLHFDYQHLTNFERQIARRAMPFYTWSARNIPLQARKLLTNPGKYANYQKIREEAAKATGVGQQDQQTRDLYQRLKDAGVKLPSGWEQQLTEWEQRNAGIPINWKGQKFTLSMGLPIQDLNELPGAAGAHQFREYADKAASLVNPLVKDPTELAFNYSFFFRNKIEQDTSPLVAAPDFVGSFPASVKRKFGVTKIIDKRTGKRVWGWPGRVDYVAHTVPGIPNYAQQFATSGTDRRGKGLGGKVLGFAGLKSVPVDPIHNAVNLAYARMTEIQKQLAGLRQQGVGKDNPTAEWRRLNDQLKIVTEIAYQGKQAQGYAVLPTSGGPSKARVKKPKASGGGFFGGSSSSSGSSSGGFFDSGSSSSSKGGFFN